MSRDIIVRFAVRAGFAVLFAPSCVGLVFSLFCLVLPKRVALVAHVWLEVARLVSRHDLIYSKDQKMAVVMLRGAAAAWADLPCLARVVQRGVEVVQLVVQR